MFPHGFLLNQGFWGGGRDLRLKKKRTPFPAENREPEAFVGGMERRRVRTGKVHRLFNDFISGPTDCGT